MALGQLYHLRYITKISFTFLLLLGFLGGCQSLPQITPTDAALRIRLAINSNNLQQFQSLIAPSILINEQEWESAPDGTGFVLGHRLDRHIDIKENTKLKTFIESVTISGKKAITEDIVLALFASELSREVQYWTGLSLILFKRGQGDVEHIVLLGLDAQTKQLKAIYVN